MRVVFPALLLVVATFLAGCGDSDDGGPYTVGGGNGASGDDPRNLRIFDAGRFDGAVDRHWEVDFNDTSYERFFMQLRFTFVDGGGPNGEEGFTFKDYHIVWTAGDGTEAKNFDHPQFAESYNPDFPNEDGFNEVFFQPLPGSEKRTGVWTIDLDASDASADYALTIELSY